MRWCFWGGRGLMLQCILWVTWTRRIVAYAMWGICICKACLPVLEVFTKKPRPSLYCYCPLFKRLTDVQILDIRAMSIRPFLHNVEKRPNIHLKFLRCLHHKIFKTYVTIFQHYKKSLNNLIIKAVYSTI